MKDDLKIFVEVVLSVIATTILFIIGLPLIILIFIIMFIIMMPMAILSLIFAIAQRIIQNKH